MRTGTIIDGRALFTAGRTPWSWNDSKPPACPGEQSGAASIAAYRRIFAFRDPKFWDAYRDVPAWSFARFLEIADRGKPHPAEPRAANPEAARQREREDLEASIEYTRKLLGL